MPLDPFEIDFAVSHEVDHGCRFVVDGTHVCGTACKAGSSYCAAHHARCYLPAGSRVEGSRIRDVDRLADAVGGRFQLRGRAPSEKFLRRLDAIVSR